MVSGGSPGAVSYFLNCRSVDAVEEKRNHLRPLNMRKPLQDLIWCGPLSECASTWWLGAMAFANLVSGQVSPGTERTGPLFHFKAVLELLF